MRDRRLVVARAAHGERAHIDADDTGDIDAIAFVHENARVRVSDLEGCLAGGQARVDRGECRAEPPRGEHCDDELGAVGQQRRDHVTGADAVLGEQLGRRADSREELVVGEREPVVVDAGSVRVDSAPPVGQRCKVLDACCGLGAFHT